MAASSEPSHPTGPPTAMDHVTDLVTRHFHVVDGELYLGSGGTMQAGGIGIRALAERFGTPLYIYDEAILQRQLQALRAALPEPFSICYSVKANPSQYILRYFVGQGCGLEIASRGELVQTLAAKCPPEKILYAGPGKTEAELAFALDQGVGEIHVESLTEAERVSRLAAHRQRPARIALRINPSAQVEGGSMRMGAKPVPFGIDEDQLDAVLDRLLPDAWLNVVGLHLFMGTQILDYRVLLAQYRAGAEIARRLASRLGRPLETLDFGGGLGVPYFAHEQRLDLAALGEGLRSWIPEITADPQLAGTRLVVEPGRFLVAESGLYVTRVNDIKTSRGKKFVIVDGGMHHHLAASGNLGQTIKRNFPVAVLNKLDQPPAETVDIVGPLCTPLDVLARGITLSAVEVGDLIGVFQSGAYARSASPLGFLSHPAPAEVVVSRDAAHLIRRRGVDDDLLADQTGYTS